MDGQQEFVFKKKKKKDPSDSDAGALQITLWETQV